jgi:hypothetical protein
MLTKATPNIPLPFEVSYIEGLPVAFNVWDTTAGTFVLIDMVPMTYVTNWTYSVSYTFEANKTYLVNISVYTDDTYTTPDTDYPPSSATYVTLNNAPVPCNDEPCDHDRDLYPQQPAQEYALGFPQVLGVVVSYSGVMPSNLGVRANAKEQE